MMVVFDLDRFIEHKEYIGRTSNPSLAKWLLQGCFCTKPFYAQTGLFRTSVQEPSRSRSDPQERWATDAIVDFVNDYLVKLVEIVFFEKRLDESG